MVEKEKLRRSDWNTLLIGSLRRLFKGYLEEDIVEGVVQHEDYLVRVGIKDNVLLVILLDGKTMDYIHYFEVEPVTYNSYMLSSVDDMHTKVESWIVGSLDAIDYEIFLSLVNLVRRVDYVEVLYKCLEHILEMDKNDFD